MEPIAKIRKDMEFNRDLGSLINVMKTIAVMQFHILERKVKTFERFLRVTESFFPLVGKLEIRHPFVKPLSEAIGVIAVTSDTGLLGGLNMQIIRTAIDEYAKHPGKLIVVGKKGHDSMRGFDIPFVMFPGINDDTRFEQALQLRDYAIEQISKGKLGPLKIVYPHAVSFVIQKVEIINVLPCTRFLKSPTISKAQAQAIIMESTPESLVEYLIFLWMGQTIYEILGWSRLAELAARYNHLESSTQKIEDLNKKLKLKYHKVRHQLIDRSMSELFAAKAVYGSK